MNTPEILQAFARLKALVIGDICLDRWCTYDPGASEPSRETGISRLGVVSAEVTPGAGGTVASNLAALGAGQVEVIGVRGDDGFGFELEQALAARGIATGRMVKVQDWQTFTYTKLLNSRTGKEDQPRVDFISNRPLHADSEQSVIENILLAVPMFDVIVIADQAETSAGGVVTPAVRDSLSRLAEKYPQKIFLADSRKRVHLFRKLIMKPNREEAEAACQGLFGKVDFPALQRHLDAEVLMVTHGPRGAVVIQNGEESWAETRPAEHPIDICGAGDSFAAACALTLAATRNPVAAARLGNVAASITIMKRGTGTASAQEILAAEQNLPARNP
ncbi:MAG TPA: PfkB family carbohydrate kinase [Terriglobia bacterium]|nr:PfkB family carbohydrate kinase [Terriglobia bacterium]